MIIIREYLTKAGRSPFGKWFGALDNTQALKVKNALDNLAIGKVVATKSLKGGLWEVKIRSGGLRVYFTKDGDTIILLLGGGQKDGQSQDIENARNRIADYEERKEQENG